MKVIAINGSPKKAGNTFHALKLVSDELIKQGIAVEILHVGNKNIRGCLACNKCLENLDEKCVIKNDIVNEYLQKMKAADGIIFGSPVHYCGIAGTMKCFLDRAILVGSHNGMLRHKVAASVVAVRRSGGIPTFNQLNNYIAYC